MTVQDVVDRLPSLMPVTGYERPLILALRHRGGPCYDLIDEGNGEDDGASTVLGTLGPYAKEKLRSRTGDVVRSQVRWSAVRPDGDSVTGFVSVLSAVRVLMLPGAAAAPGRRWRVPTAPADWRPQRIRWACYVVLWLAYLVALAVVLTDLAHGRDQARADVPLLVLAILLWLGGRLADRGRLLSSYPPLVVRTEHGPWTVHWGRLLAPLGVAAIIAVIGFDALYGYRVYQRPGLTLPVICLAIATRLASFLLLVSRNMRDLTEVDWRFLRLPRLLTTGAPLAVVVALAPYAHEIDRIAWLVASWVPIQGFHLLDGWVGTYWVAVPVIIPVCVVWLTVVKSVAARAAALLTKALGDSGLTAWLSDEAESESVTVGGLTVSVDSTDTPPMPMMPPEPPMPPHIYY